MKKYLKKSDKGFSLVELIVVICIMAVLVGVITPAFVKYVQKSKTNVDESNRDQLQRTANSVLADESLLDFKADTGLTFKIVNGAVTENNIDKDAKNANGFQGLLEAALGFESDGKTVKYPKRNGTTTEGYLITVTGSKAKGYSATVTME